MAIKYGTTELTDITYDGVSLDRVIYDGVVVFDKGLEISYTLYDDSYKQVYQIILPSHIPYWYSVYMSKAIFRGRSTTTLFPNDISIDLVKSGGTFAQYGKFTEQTESFTMSAGGVNTKIWYSDTKEGTEVHHDEGLGLKTIKITYGSETKTIDINRGVPTSISDITQRDYDDLKEYQTGSTILSKI